MATDQIPDDIVARLADLETRIRRQALLVLAQFVALAGVVVFVGVRGFAPATSAPPLAGWSIDARGRATLGDTRHRSGAVADVVSSADAGLALITREERADPSHESFLVLGYTYPDGSFTKTMSLSNHWSYPPNPRDSTERVLLTRLFTTYAGANAAHRDENIGFMQCGGFGTIFYPGNGTNGMECPGKNTVLVNGPLIANQDLRITGHLFLNGREIR